ncbi:MAG: [protein-PII] uridylyltransferase [Gammaproteobacteria bacterium]|nr:[protein-PII] uridylyltransferase [Gammaproteobacteria bacterium]
MTGINNRNNQFIDSELFDEKYFENELQKQSNHLTLFKETLQNATAVLKQRFMAGRAATELVHARSHIVDAVLIKAWLLYFPEDANDIALLAVGGYGRGELHPASDVDVQILLKDDEDHHNDALSQFITFLWDIGLEIGHSVRTLKECVAEATADITVATNLQEGRLLVGPTELFNQQRELCAPDKIWPSKDFFQAKLDEQINRHQKYHDTAYNLEPNIKEGPGGLRDIQVIGWVAKRHFGADTLEELVKHQFLTQQEYQSLHEGQAFLWKVRFGLHVISGRREDRLLFDHQRELAKQFGYRDDRHHLAVEYFMKQYYRTVMELSRLNEMLLQLFKEEILLSEDSSEPVKINSRFQSRKGFLEVAYDGVFKRYPFALLEVFLILEQHPELKGVRANTIRLIRDHRYLINQQFRSDLRCKSLFMEIMRQTEGVTHELRRMNLYGILAAYLPVFENIVGQMQHDLFHVYTVDEHTLTVIRNLRRYTVPEHYEEFPLCSYIMNNVPKQEIVLLAGLFHDIAKGRGGDHAILGADDAMNFCKEHGLSDFDSNLISWLVRSHLIMSSTAQRKDITDPDVVQEFAQQMGDKMHLDYLFLLTVSDIRATSPSVWNSWKGTLLRELYSATEAAFRRGLENPVIQSERVNDYQRQAREILNGKNIDNTDIDILWDKFGEEYFTRYAPNEIVWHSYNILQTEELTIPLILLRERPQGGGTEIFIHTQYNSNLFTIITTLIEQINLTVMDARIFTSQDNYTLDTFLVLEADGSKLTDTIRINELKEKLYHYITKPETNTPGISNNIPRAAKHFKFPTRVSFEDNEIQNQSMMKVIAYDRPGLLSKIGSAMHACNVTLHKAKIATFGEKAEDIFYITNEQGNTISDKEQLKCLEQTIIEGLNG